MFPSFPFDVGPRSHGPELTKSVHKTMNWKNKNLKNPVYRL